MPAIPLGLKAYRRQANFQPEIELVNMFIEADDSGASPDKFLRLMRPGLKLVRTAGLSASRGMYAQQGVLGGDIMQVSGDNLYRNAKALGTIQGADTVAWAASITRLFVLGGGAIHYTEGLTVETVSLPNDTGGVPVDIDSLNSYVIISFSNGRIYWIVPGETTVDPLNFVNAESAPDGLVAGRRLESEIFFFGQSSVEPWQLTGDADAPFQKALGRQYERGAKDRDSVRRFDNSIVWVGENNNVYRASTQPEVVADEGISERIRKATAPTTAMTISFDRHEFYALRIPGQGTFLLDAATRQWCRWKTADRVEWAPSFSAYKDGMNYVSVADAAGTWQLDPDSALDGSTPIEWVVTGNVAMMGRPQRNDSIAIGVGCSATAKIRLRWHDAREDYPDYFEELEARAPSDVVTMYRMGSIEPPFRVFEVSGNDGVRVRISGAATEAWQ